MIGIKDYPKYFIDIDGSIINNKGRKLRTFKSSSCEYPKVRLWKNQKPREYMIHRLVALHLVPNTNNKTQVNHIDGDKNNFHPKNLEWVTPKENMQHALKMGLFKRYNNQTYKGKLGKDHNRSIKVQDNNGNIYYGLSEASRITGIAISTIHASVKENRPLRSGLSFIII